MVKASSYSALATEELCHDSSRDPGEFCTSCDHTACRWHRCVDILALSAGSLLSQQAAKVADLERELALLEA